MTFLQRHAYDIGYGLAALIWPFFGKRRRISVDNILKAGITSDANEAHRIAKRSFCHLAGHIGEALCVPSVVTRERWREHLDDSELDPEMAHLLLDSPEKPILAVGGHHGAWEAATNILSFARPMIAVARVQNNKFVARWMKEHHFRGSVTLVDKNRGFSPAVIRQWMSEKSAMTILIDQHASHGEKLTFLGRPARTFTSATRLARRYGVPIVVGSFVRTGPYRYKILGGKPLVFAKDADIAACTQLLNDRISELIRKCPEQYLWAHRRWRDD